MPGANATGKRAINPIKKQPSAEARHVATNTAPLSIPAFASISGLTKII